MILKDAVAMAKSLTFIHAADLHLGAPFRGFRALSEAWAKKFVHAIASSYARVVDAAISHKVDFVVIAGDIFDTAHASYADYRCFFDGLQRLNEANIPVYMCSGNHDPLVSWQDNFFELPPNTIMFPADKPGFEVYERDGEPMALIGGRGYQYHTWPVDKDIAQGITRAEAERATGVQAPFCVAVLHTGLHIDREKAPTKPSQLLSSNIDYWALGHIHRKYVHPVDDPKLVFSGCIQGRDIRETGERGVFKVTLSEDAPNKLEFIPTASIVWKAMDVDVNRCTSIGDIVDKTIREMFRENSKIHCEEMCVRITLRGESELHRALQKQGVLEDMRHDINEQCPLFFCDALLDKTKAPIDKDALTNEALFPSVFLHASQLAKTEKAELVEFLEDEFFEKKLKMPRSCERNLEQLIDDAENLVLEMLMGDGESCF